MVLTGPCLEYLLQYLAIQKQNYNILCIQIIRFQILSDSILSRVLSTKPKL